MKPEKSSLITLTTTFLIVIAIFPFVTDVFEQAGIVIFGEEYVASEPWLYTVFAYIPLLFLLIIYIQAMLDSWTKYGFVFNKTWLNYSIIGGIISAIVIFLIDIQAGILENFGAPPDPSVVSAIGFLFAWGLLAPFAEELLFRGVIQGAYMRAMESKWKVHPAVYIGVGFELALHLGFPLYFTPAGSGLATVFATLPQLMYVAFFGIVGGLVYQKTKSILGPFLIHAIGNAGELILFWLFV